MERSNGRKYYASTAKQAMQMTPTQQSSLNKRFCIINRGKTKHPSAPVRFYWTRRRVFTISKFWEKFVIRGSNMWFNINITTVRAFSPLPALLYLTPSSQCICTDVWPTCVTLLHLLTLVFANYSMCWWGDYKGCGLDLPARVPHRPQTSNTPPSYHPGG